MKVIVFFAAICIFAFVMSQTNAEAKNIDEPEIRETRRVKELHNQLRSIYAVQSLLYVITNRSFRPTRTVARRGALKFKSKGLDRPRDCNYCSRCPNTVREYYVACSWDDECGYGSCDRSTHICRCYRLYKCNESERPPGCDTYMSCRPHVFCFESYYACKCTDGYSGWHCETKPHCTRDRVCNHGKCINYKCVCNKGFAGINCDVVGDCAKDSECGHGYFGMCRKKKCVCEKGSIGVHCEIKGELVSPNGQQRASLSSLSSVDVIVVGVVFVVVVIVSIFVVAVVVDCVVARGTLIVDIVDHATKLITSVIAMMATKARYVKSNRCHTGSDASFISVAVPASHRYLCQLHTGSGASLTPVAVPASPH
ncbi:hypothetical protein LSAT2_024783 [Lamellibrachia satsuma]|nr:hypothetical protein LSAT2_024783 [Lamellibrachia satsuma]